MFIYDFEKGCLIRKTATSNRVKVGDVVGSVNSAGYETVYVNGKNRYVHRIIYFMHYGVWPDHIDHKDRNKRNNNIDNLRSCTQAQNNRNTKLRSNNKSGSKGVSWSKIMNKWSVRVCHNRKSVINMYFDCLELASLVAEEGRNKYHGEYSA